MRIGVDLDDVLCELVNGLCVYHNRVFGTALVKDHHTTYMLSEVWKCSVEEMFARVKSFYESEDLMNVLPVKGSLEAVKKLSEGHILYIVTSRPRWLSERTAEWVEMFFPHCFTDIWSTGQFTMGVPELTKADVVRKLGLSVLVDDNPKYLEDAKRDLKMSILFSQPWNISYKENGVMQRAVDWREVGVLIGD